jgi:dihydropyrimidine dehydrogenase (NAD+) subunit PreA
MTMGAGNVQVCTAAMTYGFNVVKEMISGLNQWMDDKGYKTLDDFVGKAVPNVTDWQYLNLNYVAKAKISQDDCIKCGRCFAACEDTSHQAIAMSEDRVFTVKDDECVACNLCVNVCPVEGCITMEQVPAGQIDERTGKVVSDEYANWTTHPNNPSATAAE